MRYLEFVPHENLDIALGINVFAYRERVIEGRRVPVPVYGTLEKVDGRFILTNDRTYFKLEEGEGVFLL